MSSGTPRSPEAHSSRGDEIRRRLKDANAPFRPVFERAGIGMALFDPDGTILDCNDALARILRSQRADLVGRTIADLTHPDDRKHDRSFKGDLIAVHGTSAAIEARYNTMDGETIWGRLTVSPALDETGQPVFAIGILEDVSERVTAQHALRSALERQEPTLHGTDERRSEGQPSPSQRPETPAKITGAIAHDLNNLLTAILANVGFVMDAGESIPAEARADLQEIRDAVLRGAVMVRKLMALSRQA
jgi:PAS domain S-box-containing protein